MSILHNHVKRRKSYLTVTTRTSSHSEIAALELNQTEWQSRDFEWKSHVVTLNSARRPQGGREGHNKSVSNAGKENVCVNRGLIRMKPRRFMGSEHFLWRREHD